ncbi:MAG: hypothetical protein CVU39_25125 [Chloroflexi bacterium HGW-Chloroflexi-10]|nr:MAG: hypothetical protein CVU39_25125 [Chloroflexi bacterium HGW-Chloroflexi-10]
MEIHILLAFIDLLKILYTKKLQTFVAKQLLFNGKINKEYQSKEVINEFTDRYKESIDDVNRKIVFTIFFVFIALYVYYILPDTETVKIPIADISVSRQFWISIAPAISYGLAILVITSFLWFMTLRTGIKMLINESEYKDKTEILMEKLQENIDEKTSRRKTKEKNTKEILVDFTNIHLRGTIGNIWIIFRLGEVFKSRWNYIWYVPLALFLFIIALSPAIIPLFFTYQLFKINYIILGTIYAIIFFPVSFLLFILLVTISMLGFSTDV